MPETNRPASTLDLNQTGQHSRYGGTTWGIHHRTAPGHHTLYTINHGHSDLSKVETDTASSTVYIDKSPVALDGDAVRWQAHTDHHKHARLIWASKNVITAALADLGYTAHDEIDVRVVAFGEHHSHLRIETADPKYLFDALIVLAVHPKMS